ncbi:MAG: ATP synthase F1 subunit epsilon [Clostridiales bacterium]|nr:ATP synthase F1 subunit epsilon [Clostridiales bacterium]
MSKTYKLDILPPEREFFSGQVEALIITAPDGELAILADHAPIVAPLVVGSFKMKIDGEWREAFNSEGFLEVSKLGTVLLAQACEWPEDIDIRRAEQSKRRSEEKLRQQRSINEYKGSKIALARAMARLRVTKQKYNLD